VLHGEAHIKSTFNNTIITITDKNGDTLTWSSSGTVGFKGSRKSTPFAAQQAAEEAVSHLSSTERGGLLQIRRYRVFGSLDAWRDARDDAGLMEGADAGEVPVERIAEMLEQRAAYAESGACSGRSDEVNREVAAELRVTASAVRRGAADVGGGREGGGVSDIQTMRDSGAGDLNAGRKDDRGKLRWHLLPWRAAARVVAVLGKGADHYGAHNWRRVPDLRLRYLDAAMRHTVAVLRGEWTDPDSGEPHLAHAAASLLFVLEDAEMRSTKR